MRSPPLRVPGADKVILKPESRTRLNSILFPLFGYSLFLYAFGLVSSAWFTHGNGGRVFWLAVSLLLFFNIIAIGRKTNYLYYLVSGLTTFLMLVGWLCAGNLDDDYLRSNSISDTILKLDQAVSPALPGLTMHRNTLAGMLVVIGVLALSFGLFAREAWVRLIGRLNYLSMFALLLVTNSRGGLVALIAGTGLLIALNLVGTRRRNFRFFLFWGLVLLALSGGYLVVSGQYQLFTPERLLNENGNSRLQIWGNTIYMLGDVPLTGFGPGNFKAVYPFYIDPSPVSGKVSQEHAHNIFLQIYGETGLAGFLAISGIFARLLWLLMSAFREKELFSASPTPTPPRNTRAVLLGKGGLAASAAMFIFGLTEFNPWNEQFTFLFWLPLALVAACYRQNSPGQFPLKFSLAGAVRRFRASGRFIMLAVMAGGFIISGLIAWQLVGFIIVNMAGLTSQQTWLGKETTSTADIGNLYRAAESSVGWTGVPRRGEAWVAWLEKDTDRAEILLEDEIYNQPNDRRALLMLGDLFAASGKKAEAITYWRRARAAPLFLERGRRQFDKVEDLGAEPYFQEAIEIDPYFWDGYYFLVALYQRHGRTAASVALLEKAQPYFPNDPRLQDELNRLNPASPDQVASNQCYLNTLYRIFNSRLAG